MSIMDTLFGKVATPGTVASPAGGQTSVAAPAPVDPVKASGNAGASVASPAAAPVDDSPLADFKGFWQNPTGKDGKPIVHTDPLSVPTFNFDPAKIQEQAKTLDFVRDINPELLDSAVGTDGRVDRAGLLNLINSVQQSAFTAATLTMGKMVNEGLADHTTKLRQALPTDIRRQTLGSTPVTEEYREVLDHPAIKPLVGALRNIQFNKNPNANPADIASNVDNLLLGLAEAMSSVKTKNGAGGGSAARAAPVTDWDGYFAGENFGTPAS